MIKPLQPFLFDNVCDFIWYSKATSYIIHFDVIQEPPTKVERLSFLNAHSFRMSFSFKLQVLPAYIYIGIIHA